MGFLSEAVELYFAGLHVFFEPTTIFFLISGVIIGIIFGCLPGLTSTMALAIFIPFTFGLEMTNAIVFLIAIYAGAVYGGSISAILINVPGTPSAVITGLDGYPMAQRGEAGRAIGLATTASVIGSLFGMVVLVLVALPLGRIVLREFGTWEFAAMAILGLSLIAYVSSRSILRGLIAGVFGLLLATIGTDPMLAYPRFSFGLVDLIGGLALIPALIGFFGVAEILTQIETKIGAKAVDQKVSNVIPRVSELRGLGCTFIRSPIIGTLVGATPGAGGSIAALTSCAIAKRFSKRSKDFGTGIPEGIVAPESANNASVGGALIPTLTMGIPGDPMTAVLIGALMIHGLSPGPLLFEHHAVFISAIYITLTLASFLILLFGLAGARLAAKALATPPYILMSTILLLCVIGAYAMRSSLFDIGVAIACGVLGYLMRKIDIPPAPIVLGLVLGPMLEDNLRRAPMLTGGCFIPFFTRPISLTLILITLFILFGPPIIDRLRAISRRQT